MFGARDPQGIFNLVCFPLNTITAGQSPGPGTRKRVGGFSRQLEVSKEIHLPITGIQDKAIAAMSLWRPELPDIPAISRH